MIFVDTNVVLALLDPSDDNHAAARRQAPRLRAGGIVLVLPVWVELTHFLDSPHLYDRLDALIDLFGIRYETSEHLIAHADTMAWLRRYREHRPDYTDAHLVLLTAAVRQSRVWTFDREFRTVWRRPDGSNVPLAAKSSPA